jgi:hypothetical protein
MNISFPQSSDTGKSKYAHIYLDKARVHPDACDTYIEVIEDHGDYVEGWRVGDTKDTRIFVAKDAIVSVRIEY